ncbi:metallophosphoesterase [Williamsia sp. CHRR-6]|uniref:metallophosphoesterase n=1 Tax=Williamsia sp. CHRR-6 TaxID=2835871 RepID=UPI001BDA80E3|nr:metallophosphoesterase [Williamsia sp. CHRR-6]MBT0567604.1 metallophosphoesterase [Williamsia sp. CHRR-6]
MTSVFRRLSVITSCALVGLGVAAAPASADPILGGIDFGSSGAGSSYTYAVIGDVPYGQAQIDVFDKWIAQINADPAVSLTFHLGDIKNGSSQCSDDYFSFIRTGFDTFTKPLIYTPGDNEWTDCHRANNGAFNPLERLAKVRSVFFDRPGRTLGRQSIRVASQAAIGVPENVSLTRARVGMATLHVVGSNDDLQPWTGIGKTAATPEQIADEKQRIDAAITQVRNTFAVASKTGQRAVAFYLQADMFDPTVNVTQNDAGAFAPLVQALATESKAFGKPVYLFNGDSHVYNSDNPLAPGSKWLSFYGLSAGVDNLTRVTVDGSSNNKDYLRVTVNPIGATDVLSWTRVPYTQQAAG